MRKTALQSLTGGATAVCFALLVVKYPLRKLGLHRLNAKMMKLHEPVSGGLVLAGALHCAAVLSGKGKPSLPAVVTGSAFSALYMSLVTACHLTEDRKKKMHDHRLWSLASALALGAHFAVVRKK